MESDISSKLLISDPGFGAKVALPFSPIGIVTRVVVAGGGSVFVSRPLVRVLAPLLMLGKLCF
jgi:hypothetical protein